MALFKRREPIYVEAVKLTWENWPAVCDLVGHRGFLTAEAVAYSDKGDVQAYPQSPGWEALTETPPELRHLGMKLHSYQGVQFVREGWYVIRLPEGEIGAMNAESFERTYEPMNAEGREYKERTHEQRIPATS